jgi:hypothetical protein
MLLERQVLQVRTPAGGPSENLPRLERKARKAKARKRNNARKRGERKREAVLVERSVGSRASL